MLYRVCKRLIEMGRTGRLEEKIDVFYATGRLSESEYTELTGLLGRSGKKTETEMEETTK